MSACNFPTCKSLAPHDMHLLMEKSSPLPMRVSADRRSVTLWLPTGDLIKRAQPDAIRKLREDVRAWERQKEEVTT